MKGQRREREIAHARNDILEAAITAFGRTGLHGTTMQDIAKEAGYTAASLYTYFKSKQEIVDATIAYLTEEYCKVFDVPIPAGLTFRQRFDIVLQRQLELIARRLNVFSGFLNEQANQSMCATDPGSKAFHENFERRISRLAQWLKDNATPEDIGGHDPELLARLSFGMAFGLLHQWGPETRNPDLGDFATNFTEFFFHGISGKPKTGARKK
jgi:AcrR family transcriptional regulator